MIATGWTGIFVVLLGCLSVAAAPAELVDLDFSRTQAGRVPDRVGGAPVAVPTFSAYGRLRGESAIPERGVRYPTTAVGRSGRLDALRLGNDGQGLGPIGPAFVTGKPFSVALWVYVYDVNRYFHGSILVVPPGPVHGRGFSLGFQKAKWSTEGWVEWRWPRGAFWYKGFAPEQWHHVVVSQEAGTIALFVDGQPADRRELVIPFDGEARLFVGQTVRIPASPGLDCKLDALTVYGAALTDAEVQALYAAGRPTVDVPPAREAEVTALDVSIPKTSFGYFRVGESIPVEVGEWGGAEVLHVGDRSWPLPLAEPVVLSFAEPGFHQVELGLWAQGRAVKEVTYPVAIMPRAATSSRIGVAELAERSPEAPAVGIRLNRVVVSWRELEPVKEEYHWRRLDRVMARSRELGAETILCLTDIPAWVPRAEGSENVPADPARYRKLWRLLANRYQGVKLYEVWHARSPNASLAGQGEQRYREYATLLHAAAEVIRRDVPDARILAGQIDNAGGLEIAAWLRVHAAADYDIFSVQRYVRDPTHDDGPRRWSKAVVEAAGKPVFSTIRGMRQDSRATLLPPHPPGSEPARGPMVDEWTAATWRLQETILELADGVERVIFVGGPGEYGPPALGTTGLPGVQGLALAVFNGWLGVGRLTWLAATPPGVFACRLDGTSGAIVFTAGEPAKVAARGTAVDMLGRPLAPIDGEFEIGARPVYLLDTDDVVFNPRQSTERQ